MTKPSWQDFGTHDESAYPELWDGVIGAWAPCLGPTGSRLHDMSRRSNWGLLTNMDNATDWALSNGQYALDFDGIDDDVRGSFPSNISIARKHTLSGWAKVSSFTKERGVILYVGSGATGYAIINFRKVANVTTTIITFELSDVSRNPYLDIVGLVLNKWIHVVGVFDNGEMRLFVDGKQIGVKNDEITQATTVPNQSLLTIGNARDYTSHSLNGQIDDCSVWNRALSNREIGQLYQLGRGGMYQRRRRRAIYLPQAGFQSAWARGSNVMLGFNQP